MFEMSLLKTVFIQKKKGKCFISLFFAQMLKKITTQEGVEDKSTVELDALKHTDWVRRDERRHNVTGRTIQQFVLPKKTALSC